MFSSLVDLFFPKICYGCKSMLSDNEAYICTSCRHELPLTNFHFNDNDETVKKILYGRAVVENATALLRFQKKGIVQELLHNLKYKGYEEIGVFLGSWLGNELKSIEHYKTINCVIPVPLHPKKFRKRGYNQVTKFGKEIAKSLKVDFIDDVLLKVTKTESQVYKSRLSRWTNPKEHFIIRNEIKIKDKHILLVDDIITTGSTLEACIEVLNSKENHKISIATMAIA